MKNVVVLRASLMLGGSADVKVQKTIRVNNAGM